MIFMKKNIVLRIAVALLLILSLFAVSCRGNKKSDSVNNGSDSIDGSVNDALDGDNNKNDKDENEETTNYDWQFDYTEGDVVEFPEVPVD